jgi:hypothetical protein
MALASRVARDHMFDVLMAWAGRVALHVATNHAFVVVHI